MAPRPPVPPFTEATARQKVQAAEDAWNTRDPERVAGAYTEDSRWRNRDEFVTGRAEIVAFLTRKWERELDYALRKDLWAFTDDQIAVRFQYESRDAAGQWWRSYGNELWHFDADGYMERREASINDVPIDESERRIFGPRPESERGDYVPARLTALNGHVPAARRYGCGHGCRGSVRGATITRWRRRAPSPTLRPTGGRPTRRRSATRGSGSARSWC